jgi:hypothetical protein
MEFAIVANRPTVFRQIDLKRALRAAKAAGLDVRQVELDPATSKIIITAGTDTGAQESKPLDNWLDNHAR